MPSVIVLHDLLFHKTLVSAADLQACLKASLALRGDAARAFIDNALADCRALYAEQRSQEALPVARTCIHLADSLNDAPLLIRAQTALGNLLSMCGEWAEAMTLYSQLLQQAATRHDWRTVAANLGNTGNLYYRAGLPQLAMESYQNLLSSDLQAVEALITYRAAYGMAQCQMALGRHCAGFKSLQIALALNGTVADPYDASVVYKTHSGLLMQAGRLNEAGEAIARLIDVAREHDSPRIRLEMLPAVGSYEMACGHLDQGYHRLLEALDLAHDTQHEVPYVLLTLAQSFARAGNTAKAEAYQLQLAQHLRQDLGTQVLKPPLILKEKDRQLLALLKTGMSFKEIAEEMGRSAPYWSKEASRLYQILGVDNRAEACIMVQESLEAAFPYIAVDKGLMAALGKRHALLPDNTRALLKRRQSMPMTCAPALLDQLIVGFNTYQRLGNKPHALQLAAAVNQQIKVAEAVAEAGAAAMALTFDYGFSLDYGFSQNDC